MPNPKKTKITPAAAKAMRDAKADELVMVDQSSPTGEFDVTKNWFKIVETDNFGGDYPDEKQVNLPPMSKEQAERVAKLVNEIHCSDGHATRYWKVCPWKYELQPGFEP